MKDFFPESLGQKCGCALYMLKYRTSAVNICVHAFWCSSNSMKIFSDNYQKHQCLTFYMWIYNSPVVLYVFSWFIPRYLIFIGAPKKSSRNDLLLLPAGSQNGEVHLAVDWDRSKSEPCLIFFFFFESQVSPIVPMQQNECLCASKIHMLEP